jgi:hypothetical protein
MRQCQCSPANGHTLPIMLPSVAINPHDKWAKVIHAAKIAIP